MIFLFRMEIKVSVDGVQRIVCGVTEVTMCQEVVVALAQALGKLRSCITIDLLLNLHIKNYIIYTKYCPNTCHFYKLNTFLREPSYIQN